MTAQNQASTLSDDLQVLMKILDVNGGIRDRLLETGAEAPFGLATAATIIEDLARQAGGSAPRQVAHGVSIMRGVAAFPLFTDRRREDFEAASLSISAGVSEELVQRAQAQYNALHPQVRTVS